MCGEKRGGIVEVEVGERVGSEVMGADEERGKGGKEERIGFWRDRMRLSKALCDQGTE